MRSRDSSFYLRCIKNRKSYKIELFLKSNFVKIDKKRARLDTKKDRANEETKAYYTKTSTALIKIVRIRKLRRFLASREAEMIRRGLENIKKLEKLEEQEKLVAELVFIISATISSGGEPSSLFSSGEFELFLAQKHPD